MILAELSMAAGGVLAADAVPNDGKGSTSLHPMLPPTGELIIGSLAAIIVVALIWRFAGDSMKQGMKGRTERIQKEIDEAAEARSAAAAEAERIRESLGDIDSERTRLFAEADAQAERILEDGRARLSDEVEQLEARADADIETAKDRGADDLRADIVRYSSRALEASVHGALDDATHQQLIENFISRVGAQNGVST